MMGSGGAGSEGAGESREGARGAVAGDERVLDLNKSLYDLTEEHPELIPVLKELGFVGAANPVARATMGRVTTIPQGCHRLGIELESVLRALRERGYEPRL